MIALERGLLPEDEARRHAALRDYFCDKDAVARSSSLGWTLSLGWSPNPDRYVDPRLDEGLRWWGGGIDCASMPLAVRSDGHITRTLYDTWTLHCWSQWLAKRSSAYLGPVVILHADDHRDLGSPRLFVDDAKWVDAITGAVFDLRAPTTVLSAIESGALGMGSFLTPFLHAVPNAEVRHLCQQPKVSGTKDWRVGVATVSDTLLSPGRARPAVTLDHVPDGTIGPGYYRTTSEIGPWLEGIGEGPVLLHIDMDYFNNRYDGDSEWEQRASRLDPPITVICDRIDDMVNALRKSGLKGRIEGIVVAFSPGFFPAELWRAADERLHSGLKQFYE